MGSAAEGTPASPAGGTADGDWKALLRRKARGSRYGDGQRSLSPRTAPDVLRELVGARRSGSAQPGPGKAPNAAAIGEEGIGSSREGWGMQRHASGPTEAPPEAGQAAGSTTRNRRLMEYLAHREARERFIQAGPYGPEQIKPYTGLGGFEATYYPAVGMELIRIGGGVTFRDAISVSPKDGKLVAENEKLLNAVRTWNANTSEDQRLAIARQYQWSGAEKTPWLNRLKSAVERSWSGRFFFHCNQEDWQDLAATPTVTVDIYEGPKAPEDHLSLEVWKFPENAAPGIGVVQSGSQATDNQMTLASGDVAPRNDNLLDEVFEFDAGKSVPSQDMERRLKMMAIRFRSGTKTPPHVQWFVQGDGLRSREIARSRFEAIRRIMVSCGFEPGRLEFAFGGNGRGAWMIVGAGNAQPVAVHEFGHAFGLADEYATDRGGGLGGTGSDAGRASGHDGLARMVGLPGSVHENNDGLMSIGAALKPAYGTTFLLALQLVSASEKWVSGTPRNVPIPEIEKSRSDAAGEPRSGGNP